MSFEIPAAGEENKTDDDVTQTKDKDGKGKDEVDSGK